MSEFKPSAELSAQIAYNLEHHWCKCPPNNDDLDHIGNLHLCRTCGKIVATG